MGTEPIQDEKARSENPQEKGLSKRAKILTTIAIFYGNITFGCAMTAYSPSLTDFKNKFDTDTTTISVIFTIILLTYMVGALLCTVLYKFINRQFAVIIQFVGIAAGMFLSPFVPNLTLFYVLGGLLGFCFGCYDAAQFVWIMEMWQADSGPFVQAQHFFYALGTVVAPVVMSPFLTKEDDEDDDVTTTTTAKPEENENSKLFVPFLIFGIICSVTFVAQLLLFIFMKYRPPPPESAIEEEKARKNAELKLNDKPKDLNIDKGQNFLTKWFYTNWPGWAIARLVILSMLTIGFNMGMEMATMQLFPTFGQNSNVQLSESKAADTLTGLTIAYTVGRGLSVILVLKIQPQFILFGNILLVLIGNILLVGWGNDNISVIWASGILYGLGFSSLLPSFCTYMERYIEFTNTVGSLLIVLGSTIGALYPVIIGSSIEHTPLVLSYPVFFSLGVIIISVGIAYNICRKSVNRAGEKK